MPRLPTANLTRLPRSTISVTRPTPFIQTYVTSSQQPGQTVEGESDKSPDKAKPKILSTSPPKEDEAPQDVQQHNKEMKQRADRPAEKVKDEDVEKDKVGKGFWSGQGKVGGGPE